METEKLTFQAVMKWTEEECREFLIRIRWPNGSICPKCGAANPYIITRKVKAETDNKVQSLYRCRSKECRKQYTATVGTIFEDSHIPLNKWLAALFLMCSSKKGISAHQLYRMLDLGSYRTAWFLGHRIREAMKDKGVLPMLSGTVEADETYLHPRWQRGHKVQRELVQDEIAMGLRPKPRSKPPYQDNPMVFGMLERGGSVRTFKVDKATAKSLHPIIFKYMDALQSTLITDAHPAYRLLSKFMRHETINHELEYVRGDVHTQGIENYWSLFKRGVYGTFHHIGEDYVSEYTQEFEYRFNRRKMSDAERFAALMARTQGRLLWYCRTPQPENPYA